MAPYKDEVPYNLTNAVEYYKASTVSEQVVFQLPLHQ